MNLRILGICNFSEILGRNINICKSPTPVSIISISKSLLFCHIASIYFNRTSSEIYNCAVRPEIRVKFAHKNMQFLQIQQFVSKDVLLKNCAGVNTSTEWETWVKGGEHELPFTLSKT